MPAQPLLEDARQGSSKDTAPAIAIRIPVRSVGFVLIGLVAVVMIALASWNVDDPSFSYATSTPARNWLGFPGAVIADLSFQIFGLGMLAVLVPPALWGWSLVRMRVPAKMGLRLVTWVGASLLFCGFLSFVAAPESWPLPTGLGGLIGAGFSNLAQLATGENPQPVTAVLFAIIIAAPTLALFWIAVGLGRVSMPAAGSGRRVAAGARATEDGADIEPERDSFLDILAGAVVHAAYSTAAAFRRARAHLKARSAEHAAEDWRSAAEPSLDGRRGHDPDGRREPVLVAERRIAGPGDYEEELDEAFEAEDADETDE
jgi:DNA segregation ATPase FtsK/SpoIIIE, S-DNA-T family